VSFRMRLGIAVLRVLKIPLKLKQCKSYSHWRITKLEVGLWSVFLSGETVIKRNFTGGDIRPTVVGCGGNTDDGGLL